MKRWLLAALSAAVLAGAGAPTAAQAAPPQLMAHGTDVPGGRGIPVPDVIILEKDHPMHGNAFSTRLNKSAYWRAEVVRKGEDVAFTEWMQQDHPYEYANSCVKQARQLASDYNNTGHMAQFKALLDKRADLRSEVQSQGIDVAFADWLRREHPDLYRKHFGLDKKVDPMNDKQMPRGMPM